MWPAHPARHSFSPKARLVGRPEGGRPLPAPGAPGISRASPPSFTGQRDVLHEEVGGLDERDAPSRSRPAPPLKPARSLCSLGRPPRPPGPGRPRSSRPPAARSPGCPAAPGPAPPRPFRRTPCGPRCSRCSPWQEAGGLAAKGPGSRATRKDVAGCSFQDSSCSCTFQQNQVLLVAAGGSTNHVAWAQWALWGL